MSAVRYVDIRQSRVRAVSSMSSNTRETSLELDSHADTCCIGRHAYVFQDFDKPVTVFGYDPQLGSKEFRTVSAAIGYTHPGTGQTYHLVIHQAIEIPHLDHHLLCPMQCRVNEVVVNDCPKFLTADPRVDTHAVVVTDPENPYGEDVVMPLCIKGVTSYLPVFAPTQEEWESARYPRIELTSETLIWDPLHTGFQQQEEAMTDLKGEIAVVDPSKRGPSVVINSLSSFTPLADVTHDENFGTVLESKVRASASIGKVVTRSRKGVDAQTLSRRWEIPHERAKTTVKKTTQRGVRQMINPTLSRRYPTNDRWRRYNQLPHQLFTDTMFAGTVSSQGNTCSQIFAADFGWARAYSMPSKGKAPEALDLLFKREGVPPAMVMDNAKEQTLGDFRKKLREVDCHVKRTEPHSPWMNACETQIRELKRGSSRKMLKTQSPKKLWDHCLELEAYIRSCTAHDLFRLGGEVPETLMKGSTADISPFCEYAWFEWVMYLDDESWPDEKLHLGRYLGPSVDVGTAMTAKILKSNGEVIPRSTLRRLNQDEIDSKVHAEMRTKFMQEINDKLGPAAIESDFPDEEITPEYQHWEDDPAFPKAPPEDEQEVTPEAGDNYVSANVLLPRGDTLARGRVIGRKRDTDGNPIGRAHSNPILDTREYMVEFEDGDVSELTANVIAQSMYEMCDENGDHVLILDTMIDHRKNDAAVSLADQKFVDSNGREQIRRTTKGWQICVQWKDESTSWEKLSDLKECYPVQTAEYAVNQGIDHEPAFNYWVPQTLKKRNRIISLVKKRQTRYLKKTMKFGIEVPKDVTEAYKLDEKNGNTFWADAIAKEMKDVRVAFDILPDGEQVPKGYQHIRCHMIFDVKMEDFRRKARLVAGGHTTEVPKVMTYSSVVSRDTVRLALTLAALNDLEVKAGDIMNAYVTAPVTEKIWTKLGPEFGDQEGKKAIIVRALYGLRSSGAAFRAHLADCMRHIGYTSCKADPDLWLKPMKNEDGVEYYSYVLCYVDDVLVIHHDAMGVLDKIDKYLTMKPTSKGDPGMYLGVKLKYTKTANGVMAWAMSPSKYVQEAVSNCKKHIGSHYDGRYTMPKSAPNAFLYGYDPDVDVTPPCPPDQASYYMSIIGVLRWIVELGRVDIATEVSLLSSYLAYPREGHLEAAVHVMAYLRQKHNSRLVLDPCYPKIDQSTFNHGAEWKDFYGEVSEAIPHDAPQPRGKDVDLRMFVDSDHAGDTKTRRSRTGFMIFVNMALITWLSKRQPTLETSVFGAEFVAMKHGIETLRGLRYKLRMMGVPISGPSYVYGDNMSVIHNTSRPESTLKKKCNAICYHAVREAVAMKEAIVSHISTNYNWADLLTKVLYGQKRRDMVGGILYDIYDH